MTAWNADTREVCRGRCGDRGEPPCWELQELTSPAPDAQPCLDCLIESARRIVAAMTPEDRKAMYHAQRESFVRAEMAFGSDEDEAAERAAMKGDDA